MEINETKTVTYIGQLGEYSILITRQRAFTECSQEEKDNSPLGTDITMVTHPDFNIHDTAAVILKAEVIQDDQFRLWRELDHTKAFSSTEALLDDFIRKEAEELLSPPENARIVYYSTRTCNRYQRQCCFFLAKKKPDELASKI